MTYNVKHEHKRYTEEFQTHLGEHSHAANFHLGILARDGIFWSWWTVVRIVFLEQNPQESGHPIQREC